MEIRDRDDGIVRIISAKNHHVRFDFLDVGEGRVQIVDGRGRLVREFQSAVEARAFAEGYDVAREDAAAIVRTSTDSLVERVRRER